MLFAPFKTVVKALLILINGFNEDRKWSDLNIH